MSPVRERVVRGTVASEHLVHLFDEPGSLVEIVASHLHDGWQRGDTLLVVARAANLALISAELDASGCPVAELTAKGRIVFLDAATTLATLTVDGDPDREKFRESIGVLVHRLCAESDHGVTAYGEMVDLLAAQGDFNGAERLEGLWNELSTECSFRLLCGYASAHFGDERSARELHRICDLHTSANSHASDLLATWLLAGRRAKFHLPQ